MPPTTAQRALRHHAEELAATLPPLLVEAARAAARRTRRDLLAIPAIRAGRARAAHRLARERTLGPALRARDRVGGLRERLDLARQLAFDGLRLGSEPADQARARRPGDARTGGAADPRRRARDPAG